VSGDDTTAELIEGLTADLTAVRRTPPLRLGLLAVLGIWLAVFLLVGVTHEPWLDAALSRISGPARFGVVLGLIMLAVGGSIAGLAGSVPGREATERRGIRIAAVGLGLAAVAIAAMGFGAGPDATPMLADARCFMTGAAMGLAPAATLVAFVRLGWVQRPRRDATLALLGAFALGGLMIHSICEYEGLRHVLLGHASIPVVIALVGTVPLAALLHRFAR
jgi:hypothetical protein